MQPDSTKNDIAAIISIRKGSLLKSLRFDEVGLAEMGRDMLVKRVWVVWLSN